MDLFGEFWTKLSELIDNGVGKIGAGKIGAASRCIFWCLDAGLVDNKFNPLLRTRKVMSWYLMTLPDQV